MRVAILFTMRTLARTGETCFAKWDEFDLTAKTWTLAPARMKMKREHIVPLPDQVIELLERLRPLTGDKEYIFTIKLTGKPISENGMLAALYRNGYKGKLTIHGLRGTGSTILNGAGFRGEVVETALAHKEKDAIRGAYNHALYLEERREMLQWYGDLLDEMRDGAKVMPTHHKRGANA
ncbi:MAG: site-specific integrase [Candidatus Thiothrix singaporensis]|uniref:Site-specific integrase n=1 Tax=Candidatus Thiothrix singaporensis TaxID=2799669 RepID=A0A7L6ASY9_9GAMM|nr:MAG: site-specific integrase [Candidatus Thiothrix singaporensis]